MFQRPFDLTFMVKNQGAGDFPKMDSEGAGAGISPLPDKITNIIITRCKNYRISLQVWPTGLGLWATAR